MMTPSWSSPSGDDLVAFVISTAAEMAGMHPQTLRQYDRLGIVSPSRSSGRARRYSRADIDRLRKVQRLSQDEGINLAGVKRIMELERAVESLQSRLSEMSAEVSMLRSEVLKREYLLRARRGVLGPVKRTPLPPARPTHTTN